MSDSVQPHRRQPTRLPCPWDSPGKNTGVVCHFLLQCMKVKSESEATQSCPTPSDPMDGRLPGSSIHGIFQARVLEWGAIAFSDLKGLVFNKELLDTHRNWKIGSYTGKKKKQLVEIIPEGAQMLTFLYKDFKSFTMNIFKELK